MDKELLYNASGAKDETAYKAITNVMKEEKTMGMLGVNKGEIWEVESGIGTKLVVVINCYEKYAATVMLQEQEPGDNAVRMVAHGIMYADAGRLGYVFYDKMVNYVRTLNQEEDQELRRAIGTALEIEPYESVLVDANREIEKLRKSLESSRKDVDTLLEEVKSKEAEIARQGTVELIEDYSLREDLAAARKEAEIYKGLYENMLQRALGK